MTVTNTSTGLSRQANDRRGRLLLDSQPARGYLRSLGHRERVQTVHAKRRQRSHQRGHPRRRHDPGRRAQRTGQRRSQLAGPPDDEVGRQREPRYRGDGEPAALRLPQLPVAHQSRPRRHAGAVSERRHRHAGTRADDQRQRPGARREQHAGRWFGRHPGDDAAPRGVRPAGGKHPGSQHLHQQLRCRAGDDRRRGRHRDHEVRDRTTSAAPRSRCTTTARCARSRGTRIAPASPRSRKGTRNIDGAQPRRPDQEEQAVLLRELGRHVRARQLLRALIRSRRPTSAPAISAGCWERPILSASRQPHSGSHDRRGHDRRSGKG